MFHKTAGFRHDSIEAGIAALGDLGVEYGFEVVASQDAEIFTDGLGEEFEVVVFLNTTGDILDEGQQRAMEEFTRSGGAFIGIHSAADTEYDWEWYGGLVGAYFSDHPAPQNARLHVVDPSHPITEGLPDQLERFDEWYNFRSPLGPGVSVLVTVDEGSYEGGMMGEDHPIVWAHEYDGGRAVYIGFGHTPESFEEPVMLTMMREAIDWVGPSR